MIATGEVLNISARNKLKGVIKSIEIGAVNAEVDVELLGGDKVVAIITNESAKELDLKDGKEVIVVIKSLDVMIAKQ
ncbi:MAG: TOBE domain-containing protein [Campylobacterales bacterium]|nr:TOBE domain-containing protein [Campylobacterales bacterium]